MTFEQWLQSRLTAHGYPVGTIDGVIGPVTTKALSAFQKARGIAVTGKADATTVSFLRHPASTVSPDVAKALPDRAPKEERGSWPRQVDVPAVFGNVGENQTTIEVPFDMVLAWDKSQRLRKMTLHKAVAPSALAVLEKVATIYNPSERAALGINLFGGSLNVRRMRGGTSYSMHSWGIAIDFDPERNQLTWKQPVARLSHSDAVPFWQAWEAEGWLSLGRARDMDWMHIQAARL